MAGGRSCQRGRRSCRRSSTVAYYAWNGVGQSVTATQTDRAISLLYALTGSYGGRAATCRAPQRLRRHLWPGFAFARAARPRRSASASARSGPASDGLGHGARCLSCRLEWRSLSRAHAGLVRHQPAGLPARLPRLARSALEQLEFHVHADFFINATARYADIVLPVATSWEREGLRAGFDGSLEGCGACSCARLSSLPSARRARTPTSCWRWPSAWAARAAVLRLRRGRGHDACLRQAGLSVAQLGASPKASWSPPPSRSMRMRRRRRRQSARLSHADAARSRCTPSAFCEHGYPPGARPSRRPTCLRRRSFPLRLGCAKTVAYCHSQHRNIASLRRLAPHPSRGDPARRCRRAQHRTGRLGAHRAPLPERPSPAPSCSRHRGRHRVWPARLVGRRTGRHALRRRASRSWPTSIAS